MANQNRGLLVQHGVRRTYAPAFSSHALVAGVTPLGIVFGSLEEFFGFLRILLHDTGVAHFTLQEVLEAFPSGSLLSKVKGFLPSASKAGL